MNTNGPMMNIEKSMTDLDHIENDGVYRALMRPNIHELNILIEVLRV